MTGTIMYDLLLVAHIVAAILFLGPTTVAVSSFQVQALAAHKGDSQAGGRAALLHGITTRYGTLSVLVPLLGFALMFADTSFWKDGNFHLSIALSVAAWGILFFVIIPRQRRMAAALGVLTPGDADPDDARDPIDWDKEKGRLSMFGGIFSLLWLIMAVIMVWQPL